MKILILLFVIIYPIYLIIRNITDKKIFQILKSLKLK